jgi:hypothetical protein
MRIGSYELSRIKNDILRDLYQKSEDRLNERKVAIAKQSRELYLKPYEYLLEKLPIEMVCHDNEYCVRIKYTPHNENEVLVDEKWVYKAEKPIINPQSNIRGSSYYSTTPENVLQEELWGITEELCNDILALRAKKQEMTNYLVNTTTKYTGSLQLRKAWKNEPAFLKHLPIEPAKVSRPKSVKKASDPDLAIPESLKIQLTNNLLEDG